MAKGIEARVQTDQFKCLEILGMDPKPVGLAQQVGKIDLMARLVVSEEELFTDFPEVDLDVESSEDGLVNIIGMIFTLGLTPVDITTVGYELGFHDDEMIVVNVICLNESTVLKSRFKPW